MIFQGQVGEGAPYVFGTSCGVRETSESSINEGKLNVVLLKLKKTKIKYLPKCDCTEIHVFNASNFMINNINSCL